MKSSSDFDAADQIVDGIMDGEFKHYSFLHLKLFFVQKVEMIINVENRSEEKIHA